MIIIYERQSQTLKRKAGVREWIASHIHDTIESYHSISGDGSGFYNELADAYVGCALHLENAETLKDVIDCLNSLNERLKELGSVKDECADRLVWSLQEWADDRGYESTVEISEQNWPRLKVLENWEGKWSYVTDSLSREERTDYKLIKVCKNS